MFQFRFSHFACSLCALALGIAAGNALYTRCGSYIDGTNTLAPALFPGFLDGFFVTLLPLLILIFLSVTVYAAPAALTALALESAQDTYYILSAVRFLTEIGANALLPCAFFIGTRAFFTYCYLLVSLRTLCYRSQARVMPGALSTVFCAGSRKFFRDYTALSGLLCVFGLFAHTVFYFS